MKITLIGTANIAFHLGKRFLEKKCRINQIVGRNEEKVAEFTQLFETEGETDFSRIKTDSDLYIIAVNDDAIEKVAEKLAEKIDNQLVVHTSGTVSTDILSPFFTRFGSLYPLQTFSRISEPDFETIPIFINSSETLPQYPTPSGRYFSEKNDFLSQVAYILSPKVYFLPDEKRVALHIAAVFVNNFTNQLFKNGQEIVEENGFPFEVLKPLIIETVRKIQNQNPADVQTGPAQRGDKNTIEKHLNFLKKTDYFEVYHVLTGKINPKMV